MYKLLFGRKKCPHLKTNVQKTLCLILQIRQLKTCLLSLSSFTTEVGLKCKSLNIPVHCFVHFKRTLPNFSFPGWIWTDSKAFYFANSSRIILSNTFQMKFTVPCTTMYCLQDFIHCIGWSPFFSGEIGQNVTTLNSPVKAKIISLLTR